MTRAISCVFHANFTKALQYNRLVVFVLPLLCYTWFQALRIEYKRFISLTTFRGGRPPHSCVGMNAALPEADDG